MKKFLGFIIIFICAFSLMACGETQTNKVDSIAIKNNKDLIVGDTVALAVEVKPQDADCQITWESSDSTIASISQSGLVTAIKEGTVTITAKVKDNEIIKDSVTLQVKNEEGNKLESIQIKNNEDLYVGYTCNLTIETTPSGLNPTIIWESSDSSIATVSDKGLVTAIKKGEATITAKVKENEQIKNQVTIKVTEKDIPLTGFMSGVDEDKLLDLTTRDAEGTHGVVASANAYASYAGYYVLQQGGNAFDAAVAVSYALGVVEPYASGLGGGGVMTAYNAKTGEYVFYNFREFTPAKATAETYNETGLSYAEGIGAAAVPTQVLGLCSIVDDFGNLDYEKVMEPAIYYAEKGFTVQSTLANNIYESVLKVDGMSNVFGNGRRALREGETLTQTAYANVLKEIAAKGPDGFYKGWVADAICKAYADRGGLVTQEDLDYAYANYPIKDTPIHGTYNGYDIYTANTPSSGGIILIEALNMLEYYCKTNNTSLSKIGNNTSEYLHLISTAMQLSYADKRHYIADRKVESVPIDGLASKAYAAQRWDAIYRENDTFKLTSSYDWGGASKASKGYEEEESPWEFQEKVATNYRQDDWEDDNGTTSFSVADSEGNIVSFTQTINHFWGAFVVPENCGFFLNNQCSSFSLSTSSVHYMKPHKQPVSHIMPTIILKDGDPVATLGSPGSTRIPSAVLQVVLNLLDFDMDIQDAINNPRVFSYAVSTADSNSMTDGKTIATHKLIEVENVGLSEDIINALSAKNYYVSKYGSINLYFGGVQGITFQYDADGNLVSLRGGADPRRDGKALAY